MGEGAKRALFLIHEDCLKLQSLNCGRSQHKGFCVLLYATYDFQNLREENFEEMVRVCD